MLEWIAIAGIIGVDRLVGVARKGHVAGTTIGTRRLEVRSPAEPNLVFSKLLHLGGYLRVDDADPDKKILVASSRTGLWSTGFLFPIFVRADAAASLILIGIRSKALPEGSLRTSRAHRRCAAEVTAQLGVPAARVV